MRTAKGAAKTAALVSLGLLAVVAAATAVVASQAARDYAGAPVCGGSPSPECRLLEEATVTSVGAATQPNRIVIGLEDAEGHRLTATLAPGYRTSRMPAAGQQVEIEVWRGQVTKVELPGRRLVRTWAASFP